MWRQASYIFTPCVQKIAFVRAAFSYLTQPCTSVPVTVLAYFCAAFLCASMPSLAHAYKAKASLTVKAEASFSYEEIAPSDATHIITAIAYEKALNYAYKKLASQRALAFGFQERVAQLAVVDELFTVDFHQESDHDKHSRVQATLTPKSEPLSQSMAALVSQKALIALRAEWLQYLHTYTKQGEHILLMSAGLRPRASHGPFSSLQMQAAQIAKNLEALWYYHTALEHFQDIWDNPIQVTPLIYKALTLAPHKALLWACLGEMELQMGKTHDAIQSLNRALELEPNRAQTLYMRGLAYLHLQQPSLAKVDVNAALALNPDNPQWLRTRGAIHMLLEEYTLMCQDLTKACAFGQCDGLQNARENNFCMAP